MSRKFALVLIFILVLINFSKETDHARNIQIAADNIRQIFNENNPTPNRISDVLGIKEFDVVRRAFGPSKQISEYIFRPDEKGMFSYYIDFDGNSIVSIKSYSFFKLRRGISLEMLRGIYLKNLGNYFNAVPRFDEDLYIWTLRDRNGGYCDMKFSLRLNIVSTNIFERLIRKPVMANAALRVDLIPEIYIP
jgi:hypothetical protein